MGRLRQGTIVACMALVTAPTANAAPIEIGHIPECTEVVPAAVAPPSSERRSLVARVLLDGVSSSQAGQYTAQAARAYDSIGIDFVVDAYQSVSFSGDDADGLIQQSKSAMGGARPAGTDVVYTLTSKDIQAGGQAAVAGLADCIGGVAFPDRAFAVGEVLDPDGGNLLGVTLMGNLTAKVFAHEIGHLMGAHHHYANCAEGVPSDPNEVATPCTLMFNDVGFSSLVFSTLNHLVVRGHSEAYTG
ncbi:MAG TPA: zinc-dependent metalloprotease family protein [Thermoleophilaceae bacterium]|nr:zinc-dependent metalloprotease family protein [Thermoleophilaceae bacterium]